MSWSREQVQLLIDQYKTWPCLYAVKSKEYKNKHARLRALESIQQNLEVVKPNVTINEIKNKFQGLKTNFLTEYRKYERSFKSGTGEDDIYHPTLWYFNDLRFVVRHSVPRAAIDNSNDTIVEDDGTNLLSQEDEEVFSEELQTFEVQEDFSLQLLSRNTNVDHQLRIPSHFAGPSNSSNLAAASSSSNSNASNDAGANCNSAASPAGSRKAGSKRKLPNDELVGETTGAIKALSEILQKKKKSEVERDGYAIFGEYIAAQLRKLPEELAAETEESLLQIIFEARRKNMKK